MLPKPMTAGNKAKSHFGKQDFRYVKEEDVYICPAGKRLAYHYTNEEKGLTLHRYWTKQSALAGVFTFNKTLHKSLPLKLWENHITHHVLTQSGPVSEIS
jgi:hypothetical protein